MKTQLNEELDSIKYLFGYKRGRVISEQKTYYQNNIDKKVHVVDNPNRVPMLTARIISKDEFLKLGGIDTDPFNTQTEKTSTSEDPNTNKTSSTVKPPSTATNIQNKLLELGKDIGPTGPDGKIGPNTINAIWDTIKDIQK
jgi:hypothetical protein